MSANDWSADFRPLTTPSEDCFFPGTHDYVVFLRGSPEIEQMVRDRTIWSVASGEAGEFLVPGAGDDCPTVRYHYRTAVPWDDHTPSVAWMLVEGLPSLEEIVQRHRDED